MKNMTRKLKTVASICVLILAVNSQASDLTIPNQFTSGTRAVAADVNANFDATAISVNDNQAQLTDLIAQITALSATVTANSATISDNATTIALLETKNTNLQTEIDALKADSVAGLSGVLTVGADNQGNTAAIFSGVNLHVNSGAGTAFTLNGLGNIIIGYDGPTSDTIERCSFGEYSTQQTCEDNNQTWSNTHKSGSHNLVIGYGHNYSRHSGLVLGKDSSILGEYASVTGGFNNIALGQHSSVSGGFRNSVTGSFSSISGGINNKSQGAYTSILGGNNNSAFSDSSSVSGGNSNTASGAESNVSGGLNNIASGFRSSISGGSYRSATGNADWVAGTLFEDN